MNLGPKGPDESWENYNQRMGQKTADSIQRAFGPRKFDRAEDFMRKGSGGGGGGSSNQGCTGLLAVLVLGVTVMVWFVGFQ